jgi:hypothetical protein
MSRAISDLHNKSLELSPKVVFLFEGRPTAGVPFALVIRRRNSTLCSAALTTDPFVSRAASYSPAGGLNEGSF